MMKLKQYGTTGEIILGSIMVLSIAAFFMYKAKTQAPELKLPQPTGQFGVGTTEYHFIDTKRIEKHSQDKNHPHRELMVKVWYPASLPYQPSYALYAPEIAPFIQEDLRKSGDVVSESLNHLNTLKSHSVTRAPVAPATPYPLVIFSPGFGTPVIVYSSLLEDLASHGYVVVGINYPYVTNPVIFPDGRVIKQHEFSKDPAIKKEERNREYQTWLDDISCVIDECEKLNSEPGSLLKNSIDLNSIGIFGHSFGGSVSGEACYQDKRCVAGIDIEGKLYSSYENRKLHKPFMFIVAPHEVDILKPIKELMSISQGPLYYVEVEGADHGSFSDLYLIARWKKQPNTNPTKIINITRSIIVDFFDAYLKNKKPNIVQQDKPYAEVVIQRKG